MDLVKYSLRRLNATAHSRECTPSLSVRPNVYFFVLKYLFSTMMATTTREKNACNHWHSSVHFANQNCFRLGNSCHVTFYSRRTAVGRTFFLCNTLSGGVALSFLSISVNLQLTFTLQRDTTFHSIRIKSIFGWRLGHARVSFVINQGVKTIRRRRDSRMSRARSSLSIRNTLGDILFTFSSPITMFSLSLTI